MMLRARESKLGQSVSRRDEGHSIYKHPIGRIQYAMLKTTGTTQSSPIPDFGMIKVGEYWLGYKSRIEHYM